MYNISRYAYQLPYIKFLLIHRFRFVSINSTNWKWLIENDIPSYTIFLSWRPFTLNFLCVSDFQWLHNLVKKYSLNLQFSFFSSLLWFQVSTQLVPRASLRNRIDRKGKKAMESFKHAINICTNRGHLSHNKLWNHTGVNQNTIMVMGIV